MSQLEQQITYYKKLCANEPSNADAMYNYAYYLKQAGYFTESLVNYEYSLALQINKPEEVCLNMAVIYSDHLRREGKAKELLQRALTINPNYSPAIYNLANLLEEEGDKNGSSQLFEKLVGLEGDNYQALARLADLTDKPSTSLVNHLRRACEISKDNDTKINLLYSLGKACNERGEYDEAFNFYAKANSLDARFNESYGAKNQESIIDAQIQFFSEKWFSDIEPISDYAPVFICGMFRSGSTLAEQILSAHPEITAGGERNFFPLTGSKLSLDSPQFNKLPNKEILVELANDYRKELTKAFPSATIITDKRPDNFLMLGLIRTLYPKCKIIHTKRAPLDNCLSIYFLRLSQHLNYATELLSIGHYYKQQEKLMAHWKHVFPDNICELNYEALIKSPKEVTSGVLEFLGLKWNDDCLDFHKLRNPVKTASVWQVRQPLYNTSAERWRNYKNQVTSLSNYLEE